MALIDSFGKTALHYAAMNLDVNVIQFVLEMGFDIECSDNEDYSPLHWAATRGGPDGCLFLINRGAVVNKQSNKTGQTPMSLLVMHGNSRYSSDDMASVQIVQILSAFGAQVDYQVEDIKSILEMAAAENVDEGSK